MKKIFAIALALVMVLSMASAFAVVSYDCETLNPSWDCYTEDTYCGQGTIEVVPYVKVNTACGWEYQVSDCAAAVRSTVVYYAIKLNVEAYPDPDFWGAATYTVESENLDPAESGKTWNVIAGDRKIDLKADEAKTYYLDEGKWVEVDEDFDMDDLKAVVKEATVVDEVDCGPAPKYEVCATLESFDSGVGTYNWGDWWVNSSALTFDEETGKGEGVLRIQKEGAGVVTYTVEDGEVVAVAGAKADVEEANAVFNLGCGWVCVVEDAVTANFGWDFEQEDCFKWSDKGASVVDTDCVVAIPKTGDMSVLAWLF